MDKQIIEGLNIFAKYKVDDDRIKLYDGDLAIFFTAFRKDDIEKLNNLGWWYKRQSNTDYYCYEF